jgi:hypothetical protein
MVIEFERVRSARRAAAAAEFLHVVNERVDALAAAIGVELSPDATLGQRLTAIMRGLHQVAEHIITGHRSSAVRTNRDNRAETPIPETYPEVNIHRSWIREQSPGALALLLETQDKGTLVLPLCKETIGILRQNLVLAETLLRRLAAPPPGSHKTGKLGFRPEDKKPEDVTFRPGANSAPYEF